MSNIQGCLILSDKQQIEMFRLKTIRSGLRLEIETGMRHSTGSVFRAAKSITGLKTRAACYRALNEMILHQEELQANAPVE